MSTTLEAAPWTYALGTTPTLHMSHRDPLRFSIRSMDSAFRAAELWPRLRQTMVTYGHLLIAPESTWLEPRPAHWDVARIVQLVLENTPLISEVAQIRTTRVLQPAPTTDDPIAAVDDLLRWMHVTHDDLASMTGIGRTTFFYWKRKGTAPHPSTLRPLWRLHSLGDAVVRTLGEGGAVRWFNSGSPTPRELLLSGETDTAENLAHRLLFQQPSLRPSRFGSIGEEDLGPAVSARPEEPRPIRRATRKPVRRRLE